MNTKPNKQKVTVHIPMEIVERLKQSAKDNRRSFNSELVWALQKYLEEKGQEK